MFASLQRTDRLLNLFIALLAALLLFPTLRWLANEWWSNDYYSHGVLVPLISGYFAWRLLAAIKMTIFSDEEEAVFEASLKGDKLRYYPAQAMARAGGKMQFVAPWQPGVVIDRELITGQNPFSDHTLASAFIAALDKQQGAR